MNCHKRSNGKNRDSYGSSVAHKALTKEVVAQRLALPNGPEHMMHYASEAFPFAYELFSEGNSAACAFLCRCAKQEKYARQLNDIMGSEREALRNALLSNQPKLRKNAAVLMGQLKVPSDVKYLKQALSVEDTRFVRPSMLLSLGSIGGDEAKAALASYTYSRQTARMKRCISRRKQRPTKPPCEAFSPSKSTNSPRFPGPAK